MSKKRSEFLRFNTFDAYLSLGIGCDFYLPFFKLNPEVKFCFGLTDMLPASSVPTLPTRPGDDQNH